MAENEVVYLESVSKVTVRKIYDFRLTILDVGDIQHNLKSPIPACAHSRQAKNRNGL